ncbi:hypothetical protein AAFO92_00795 [Roseovarius sp. CAU 1744]|uniref:hypothetical protein n=1 Tax=Roseovarius sp. CAU 1744 TaxID=3140368 RepID=UPI00325BA13A
MDADLALVLGIVLLVFSVPAIVSAFSEGRAPRVAALTILLGGSLTIWALSQKPGQFDIMDIPEAFVRVVARFTP